MSTKLIMRRTGTFYCRWTSADGKCGIGDRLTPTYNYECIIEAKPALDEHGFLIDQLDIDKYFRTRYYGDYAYTSDPNPSHPPRSCERIALNAVEDINRMLNRHLYEKHGGIDGVVKSIRVSVGIDNQAVMTAEWTPDKKTRKHPLWVKVGDDPRG